MLYTGGPRPYGYEGLGEVFVFLFFGLVAVAGSYFVQTKHLDWEAFALAVPVGLIAAGILVVNNVRDIDSDRRASKRTLAVRLGRSRTRVMFAVIVYLAYLLTPMTWVFGPLTAWVLLPWLTRAAGGANRARGAHPRRRPVAQRRAGPDRHAAARLLRAAERRAAAQPLRPCASRWSMCGSRCARRWMPLGARRRDASCSWWRCTDDSGCAGSGEAAPLPGYDGVTVADTVTRACEDCREVLEAGGRAPTGRAAGRVRGADGGVPGAVGDRLALWDLDGRRRRGVRVWQLLGAAGPGPVAVNATLTAPDRAGAAREADAARGRPVSLPQGQGRHRRRRGPDRRGAGGGRDRDGDPPGRQRRLERRPGAGGAAGAGAGRDRAAARSRRTAWTRSKRCRREAPRGASSLDETRERAGGSRSPLLRRGVPQAGALRRDHRPAGGRTRARRGGYEVYLASTLDGPLGIAAALHAAAAIGPDRPCGLATLGLFEPAPERRESSDGTASPPAGPGLGDGLVDWYSSVA